MMAHPQTLVADDARRYELVSHPVGSPSHGVPAVYRLMEPKPGEESDQFTPDLWFVVQLSRDTLSVPTMRRFNRGGR